jgi:hypothetical protein
MDIMRQGPRGSLDHTQRHHRSHTCPARRLALPKWALVDYSIIVDYMIVEIIERSGSCRAVLVVKWSRCLGLVLTSTVKHREALQRSVRSWDVTALRPVHPPHAWPSRYCDRPGVRQFSQRKQATWEKAQLQEEGR